MLIEKQLKVGYIILPFLFYTKQTISTINKSIFNKQTITIMATFVFSETVTNKELLENGEFKALLDKGEPVVFHVGAAKESAKDGKAYFQLHVAQLKELGEPNEMNKLFLGWDNTILVRCWRNVEASQLAKPEVATFCKAGAVLSNIVVIAKDTVIPSSALQKPRKTKVKNATSGLEEEFIYTLDGKPIYRTMELAYKSEGKKDALITANGRVPALEVSMPFAGIATETASN